MSQRSRNQPSRQSRKKRIQAQRAERRQRQRIRTVALVAGTVALLGLLVAWSLANAANRPGEPVPDMGNMHIEEGSQSPIAYNSTPPTSGPHYPNLARWGIYTEPIPDELMVHNLEDGGVGVWYNCPEGCPDLVAQLEGLVGRYEEGVILAPYPGMGSRIALTAWNRIDQFAEFDEERIARFVRAFRGADHHVRQ